MRREYKFLVPKARLTELRSELLPFVTPDLHAKQRPDKRYTVRSIYFDTADLDDFVEKCEGLKIRKKVRVRGYDQPENDGDIFLEIKKKHENCIEKVRAAMRFSLMSDILYNGTNGHPLTEPAKRFLYHVHKDGLRPIVLVVYEREAYMCRFNDRLRVTFDLNLRAKLFPQLHCLFSEAELRPCIRDAFILELKFSSGYPFWLQSIIERYQLRRMALSKYAICLQKQGVEQTLPVGARPIFATIT